MHSAMSTTEIFLIAMIMIFTIPYFIWRVGRTDYYAPLVVVQILTGMTGFKIDFFIMRDTTI